VRETGRTLNVRQKEHKRHKCTRNTKDSAAHAHQFSIGGPRCIGRGGLKQDYIIMSNKISKARIHTCIYYITWNLIIGGPGSPCWVIGREQWPPSPPGSYSTACLHKTSLFVIHTYVDMLSTDFKSENVSAKYFGVACHSPFMLITYLVLVQN